MGGLPSRQPPSPREHGGRDPLQAAEQPPGAAEQDRGAPGRRHGRAAHPQGGRRDHGQRGQVGPGRSRGGPNSAATGCGGSGVRGPGPSCVRGFPPAARPHTHSVPLSSAGFLVPSRRSSSLDLHLSSLGPRFRRAPPARIPCPTALLQAGNSVSPRHPSPGPLFQSVFPAQDPCSSARYRVPPSPPRTSSPGPLFQCAPTRPSSPGPLSHCAPPARELCPTALL